jgi:uncharacterized protein (TIGR02147 family)
MAFSTRIAPSKRIRTCWCNRVAKSLDIFQYGDYRQYLADFYQREKEGAVGFSHRAFALRAGLSSPNYLKLVMDGKRPITEKSLSSFLRGLKLSGNQAEYFRLLVSLKESRDEKDKTALVEKILKMRVKHSGNPAQLDKDRWEVLRHWHHWAIREFVLLKDFSPDPAWIAARLGRKVTPAQAAESLDLLLRLEFLVKEGGSYRQSDPMITTTDEISNLIIRHLHRQFVEQGLVSLFHDPVETREINGLTLALRDDQVPVFKKLLKEFRRELNRQFSDKGKPEADHVYHFETMLFPVTAVRKPEKRTS